MSDKLAEYRYRRKFDSTPEPTGAARSTGAAQPRFVVQEHRATHLHWDFRLEHKGVLLSWAVPKGVPTEPKVNRLAVRVEDHPLDYIDFAGRIPEGSYGAGIVTIWDSGSYVPHKFKVDELVFTLRGQRLAGKYALFHTSGKNWIIRKMDVATGAAQPMPEHISPMLARLSELPSDETDYAFEIKWDGIRAIFYSDTGKVRVESRNGRNITRQYPELRDLGKELGGRRIVLDGEIVAPDDEGRPSFEKLQGRLGLASEAAIRRKAREIPITYIIFDILYLDGQNTMTLQYAERRRLLNELQLDGPYWKTPAFHIDDGRSLLEASRAKGVEGLIAKRLASKYEPGKRLATWLKIKNQLRQEFVIGGWTPGEGARQDTIGALLVGYYDVTPEQAAKRGRPQRLLYAGNVGTGFSDAALKELRRLLSPLRRADSPFETHAGHGAVHVHPVLVGEFNFAGWTKAHILRNGVFKGLRDDKDPREVVREKAASS